MYKKDYKFGRVLSILLVGFVFLAVMVMLPMQTVNAESNISWQTVAVMDDVDLDKIVYGNGMFIGIGSDYALKTSPDAVTWTEQGTKANKVVWNGEIFVAVGSRSTVLTSTDGITWKQSIVDTSDNPYSLSDIIWDGNQFVVTGYSDNKGGAIFTSPDGITWSTRISNTDYTLRFVSWNGSVYVAIGYGTTVYTSSDSVNWSPITADIQGSSVNDVASNGNVFLATGFNGQVMMSPDGINWTTTEQLPENDRTNVLWDGKQFVVSSYLLGRVYTSSDGKTWHMKLRTNNIAITDMIFCNGRYVAVGPLGVWASENCENWEKVRPMDYFSSAYNGTTFVVAGTNGTILTSTDGVNWTPVEAQTSASIQDIIWNGERFIAVGREGTILQSQDGTVWSKVATDTTENIYSVVWNGKSFLAVASNNVILKSTDGYTWKSEGILTDIDPYTYQLWDVIWDGSRYIIAGKSPGAGMIAVSSDGTNWTRQIVLESYGLSSIAYNGECYVASGSSEGLFVSKDAVTWEKSNLSASPFSVIWDGKKFISVGAGGEIFTSPDGANWMPDTSDTTLDLNKVSQCGDKYIAAGDNGIIILGTVSALSGDLNGDKSVDVLDLALMREYLLKPDIEINLQSADINSDGMIDSMDYLLLKSIIIQN